MLMRILLLFLKLSEVFGTAAVNQRKTSECRFAENILRSYDLIVPNIPSGYSKFISVMCSLCSGAVGSS